LAQLLDSEPLRTRLETAASEHVLDFSLHRLAERYVEVYEQAIAVGGSSVPSIPT
jgi:hypothetical protein